MFPHYNRDLLIFLIQLSLFFEVRQKNKNMIMINFMIK